jgi:ornithine cyclodeaminase
MEAALKTLAQGDAVLPLRQAVWQPDRKGLLGLMPVYLGNPQTIGVKVVTVFPGNRSTPYESHQGSVLLFECEHGRLLAMVDAGAITAIRTAAVSAVATRALAQEGASELAILGSGTQAARHLEAMCAVRPISHVRVWSRTAEHARLFVARESARYGPDMTAVDSPQEAVEGAEIICTTTGAREPVLQGKWVAEGAHINAVGASAPGFRELDSETVAQSRLVVDRRESALNEADDIRIPLQEGLIGEDHILGELGEVLLGQAQGRTTPSDITLFKSLGLAIEDLAAGHHVYTKGTRQGLGTSLDFTAERRD